MIRIHKQAELNCNISDSGYAQLHSIFNSLEDF